VGEPRASALAVSAAGLFWLRESTLAFDGFAPDGEVVRAPLAGGAPVVLASGITRPNDLAADATHVYWTATGVYTAMGGNGTVKRVPALGGPTELLVAGGRNPEAIALDGAAVYWTDRDLGSLFRRAK
jgi:hypothetical protein